MGRFKKGAFQMAIDQRLPIVPITLNGPFEVLPIGSLNMKRHRMEVVIHPPISTADADASHKNLQQLADQTAAVIASGLWEQFRV
jgi:1-acyl-sn-glycerol-3-phosphate acyltransferase